MTQAVYGILADGKVRLATGDPDHRIRVVAVITGTGLVPPAQITLRAGDVAGATIEGLGTLSNLVEVVGVPRQGV